MNLNFYLLKDSRTKSEEVLIRLHISGIQKYKGKILKVNTSQRINPNFWDTEKQSPKRNFPYKNELSNYLEQFKSNIYVKAINLLNDDLTYEEFKNLLTKSDKKENTLIEHLDLFLKHKDSIYSLSSKKKYKTLKKHLISFSNIYDYQLSFKSINYEFFDKFQMYCLDTLKYNNNTFKKSFALLTTFINWCNEREITDINNTSKFKTTGYKTEIIVLTENELSTIENLDVAKSEKLQKVKDVFLFSVYTGQRFSDIEKIKFNDIQSNSWILRTQKTKDIIKIPLSNKAMNIIERYKFNIDFLPTISNQKYNKYLKELGKLAGIDESITHTSYIGSKKIEVTKPKYELISSHTARRTFITQSLLKGIPAEIIMKVSGHTDYKTLNKYIEITKNDVESAFRKAWG